jgi:hypothetical protein
MKIKLLALVALALSPLPAASPALAQSQVLRPILIENLCNRPVNLWVDHSDGWRNWHTHGSFTVGAYASTYLSDNGTRLHQRTDHDIYFYAETTNGTVTWDGTYMRNVDGYTLPMRRQSVVLKNGAYAIRLGC